MRNSARIKFGLLSATIISGATLATPAFAQDAGSVKHAFERFATIRAHIGHIRRISDVTDPHLHG